MASTKIVFGKQTPIKLSKGYKLPTWGVMLNVPELEKTRAALTHSTDSITTAARKKVEEVLKVAKL